MPEVPWNDTCTNPLAFELSASYATPSWNANGYHATSADGMPSYTGEFVQLAQAIEDIFQNTRTVAGGRRPLQRLHSE